jgi:hypothetical protein
MTGFSAGVNIKDFSPTNTQIVSTLVSSVKTNYINNRDGTNYVQGIILSKTSGTSGVGTYTFNGQSLYAYKYFDTNLATMTKTANNVLWAYYTNTSPTYYNISTMLSTFS